MSNPSYCRFRNTLPDFQECVDVFEALILGEDMSGDLVQPLSADESRAALQLIESVMTLALLLVEETDIEASDMIDYSHKARQAIEAMLERLNNEAAEVLRNEGAEEEANDEDDEAYLGGP